MIQNSFDFDDHAYPRFDKLLGQANAELIFMLQQEHDPFLFIWGNQGSGKSHILQAWVGHCTTAGKRAVYVDAAKDYLSDSLAQADCVAVDQVEQLDDQGQAALFNLFNRFRNSGRGSLLLAADVPPTRLQVREDLRTRMGYCLVYEVKSLDKQEKIDALINMAAARHLDIDPKIFHYLLDHWRQDLNSLLQMFEDLADYAITKGRPLTLSLLKQLLKQQDKP